jgi:tRNA(Leu) C34 or U34 (ribose-2'-O)-methylase TrmL
VSNRPCILHRSLSVVFCSYIQGMCEQGPRNNDVSLGTPQTDLCVAYVIRYYYHGESPQDGRILRIPASQTASAGVSLFDSLRDLVDLSNFAPHVRSAKEEAFVLLSPATASLLLACGDDARRVDVCLFPRPCESTAPAASSLLCDSKSAGLTGAFFAVGIVRGRAASNHGSVWRSALQFGAAYTFTVGAEYARRVEGSADVYKTARHIPCLGYRDATALVAGRPLGSSLVAVEYGGESLRGFVHPRRAVYVLGDERDGLPADLVARCTHHVSIATADGRPASLNVAAAAAIVMSDRLCKMDKLRKGPTAESVGSASP